MPPRSLDVGYRSRVRGVLLGGAIGDALGAPVEFLDLHQILAVTGDSGVREYLPAHFGPVSGYGLITDDTQMTMFVIEGIIRARVREDRGLGFTVGVVDRALLRWLDTQEHSGPTGERDGWLQAERWLYSRRAPGLTCLGALKAAGDKVGCEAANDSKGCGGVMRSAPFGFLQGFTAAQAYDLAATAAGFTHGHLTGRHASGALGYLIHELVGGRPLHDAVRNLVRHLDGRVGTEEVTRAVRQAMALADTTPGDRDALAQLGQGWVAEEALAIGLYAALSHPNDMLDALSLAVTHGGDSDSTGSICGNILGAALGEGGLPAALVFEVEGRGTLLQLADDMILEETSRASLHGDYGPYTRWFDRYPGW